ncbi:VIP36-like protein [Sarcoptes scabiei]|uniref:VIP36-like protein n=1 Tax=Sarcoptes scabiei TaxID=52283 RepID=A0A834VGW4_SARSC|nr:VIP36-like protein [Sarcoptes scabiei]
MKSNNLNIFHWINLFIFCSFGFDKIRCAHTEYEDLGFYPQKEHSLMKPYQGTGMTIPNWDILGHTIVSNSFIRITPDQQSKHGGLWNKFPITFPYWETHIEFKISGHGKDLFGDGMAIWYVRHPMQLGKVFGSADFFWGLGLFLDTYANQNGAHSHSHPYISAMVNNATMGYDHDRDGTHTELAGCEAKLRTSEHDTYLAIRYHNDTLSVMTDVDGSGQWTECFVAPGVFLPTGLYLGVTAATGDLSDNHDIISIKTYRLETPIEIMSKLDQRAMIIPHAISSAHPRDHIKDDRSLMTGISWLRFIVYLILGLIFVIILGLVGYIFYQKRQEVSRKRFY